jgi:hypothetical protein
VGFVGSAGNRGLPEPVASFMLELMRHASATTTLNIYAGLWPTDDELAHGALTEMYMERPEVEVSTEPSGRGSIVTAPAETFETRKRA